MPAPARRLPVPLAVAAAAVSAAVTASAARRATSLDWRGRVVLVAGASRGLGLAIARELVRRGARVAIAARDAERLEGAAEELRAAGGDVRAIPADVGDPARAQALVDEVVDWAGGLDALFNVAGVLEVAPVETLSVADFAEALDVMALGPIACTLAALPALRGSDAGRIATITSIGGKVPVPHLLPYATAKHAAVGFSESLRAALGPRGVRVTTVVPGFMRTGSHIHAQVKGAHEAEYRWFASLAQMPGLSMRADRAARRIVEATGRGDALVSTTWWAPLAMRAHGLAPGSGARAAARVAPALPESPDVPVTAESAELAEGYPGPADGEEGTAGQAGEAAEAGKAGDRQPPDRAIPGHRIAAGIGPLSKREQRSVAEYRQRPWR